MSANLIGAVLGATWIGLGVLFLWFLLNKTTLLEKVVGNGGIRASDLRRNFKYLALVLMLGGAVIGWQGGPIVVPIILGEF